MNTCRDCPAFATRRSHKGPAPVYCEDCRLKRAQLSQRVGHNLPQNPPMEPLDRNGRLELLIATGWGSMPQTQIPADVMADAEAGRSPRRNPRMKRDDIGWKLRGILQPNEGSVEQQ